jgi:hypothetical protein
MHTINEQIDEVKREIRMRENVYPRVVAMQAMKKATADQHVDRMRAVLKTLEGLRDAGVA